MCLFILGISIYKHLAISLLALMFSTRFLFLFTCLFLISLVVSILVVSLPCFLVLRSKHCHTQLAWFIDFSCHLVIEMLNWILFLYSGLVDFLIFPCFLLVPQMEAFLQLGSLIAHFVPCALSWNFLAAYFLIFRYLSGSNVVYFSFVFLLYQFTHPCNLLTFTWIPLSARR